MAVRARLPTQLDAIAWVLKKPQVKTPTPTTIAGNEADSVISVPVSMTKMVIRIMKGRPKQ